MEQPTYEDGDHTFPDKIEIEPEFFRAILSKEGRGGVIAKFKNGNLVPIIIDLEDFKIYVGLNHTELKDEFGVGGSYISAYAEKNLKANKFQVYDLMNLKAGHTYDNTLIRNNIAFILERDISYHF